MSKKVFITGVSRGLGKLLAHHLIQEGWMVYGSVRDLSQVEDTSSLKHLELDLENQSSIEKGVKDLFTLTDHIDAVIHNAGMAYLTPAEEMRSSEIEQTFRVNCFGPLALTKLLLPKLKEAKRGRMIYISSIASVDPWPSLGVYSASKAAFERIAFEWAVLLKKENISVSIVRPNPLPTDMQILKSENQGSIYEHAFLNELEWEKIEDVFRVLTNILDSPSPQFEYTTGPISKKTVDTLFKEGATQSLLDQYIQKRNGLIQ